MSDAAYVDKVIVCATAALAACYAIQTLAARSLSKMAVLKDRGMLLGFWDRCISSLPRRMRHRFGDADLQHAHRFLSTSLVLIDRSWADMRRSVGEIVELKLDAFAANQSPLFAAMAPGGRSDLEQLRLRLNEPLCDVGVNTLWRLADLAALRQHLEMRASLAKEAASALSRQRTMAVQLLALDSFALSHQS